MYRVTFEQKKLVTKSRIQGENKSSILFVHNLQVASSFEIADDRTRIGAVLFSEAVNILFHLDESVFQYLIAVCKDSCVVYPVVLTETENENDSANQNYVAKMMLQK